VRLIRPLLLRPAKQTLSLDLHHRTGHAACADITTKLTPGSFDPRNHRGRNPDQTGRPAGHGKRAIVPMGFTGCPPQDKPTVEHRRTYGARGTKPTPPLNGSRRRIEAQTPMYSHLPSPRRDARSSRGRPSNRKRWSFWAAVPTGLVRGSSSITCRLLRADRAGLRDPSRSTVPETVSTDMTPTGHCFADV
jgi:hypothetical protein